LGATLYQDWSQRPPDALFSLSALLGFSPGVLKVKKLFPKRELQFDDLSATTEN
jgi:hypothetical protein